MLSRTADHLFWMSRYTERAENTARLLDVNYQTSLLPQSAEVAQMGWQGLLSISELLPSYQARHGDITPHHVMEFMVKDENNPSSIISCLRAARENARAVRGSLTTEVWETQNQTWLELNRMLKGGEFERDPGQFFEWVKFRSHLSRGVTVGTMLMDEALHFMRLGTFLERADNTARLVDVKFHAVAHDFFGQNQSQSSGAGQVQVKDQDHDFYHWSAILRSVSGFEIYRKVYRDVIQPERVAELLILRADMPRSLHACLNEVVNNIAMVSDDHAIDSYRRAGKLRAEMEFGRIEEILANGLHAYLTQFLDRVNEIGASISREFLVPN
ncbi:alpha-E domain-containing protein [Limnohabitans sp.]|uniref:alpha-E domain-containing protein n=1 Tax=Limnohabitans sp. TaxID=1907725 RepID=UPI00286F6E20|nr:alpha-E domain-containing protein [Limnohabitans sp.]